MDAILFIVSEHDKIRRTLVEVSDKDRTFENRQKLFAELCDFLTVHEQMEQEVWYPLFYQEEEVKDIVKHLLEEETKAAMVIKEFKGIKSKEAWEDKFKDFKNDVEHHAKDEENKLFPKVKKILDQEELDRIGKVMFNYKQKYNTTTF